MLLNCSAGEDSSESLDCKEIKPVNPKGNQPWIFTGSTDARAEAQEALILWPPNAKSWLIRKDPDARKRVKAGREGDDRGWDGWMTSPSRWMGVWAQGVGDGQGSLVCYTPWGCKELDTTEWLNWTELNCPFSYKEVKAHRD